jgi:hypothetical protein
MDLVLTFMISIATVRCFTKQSDNIPPFQELFLRTRPSNLFTLLFRGIEGYIRDVSDEFGGLTVFPIHSFIEQHYNDPCTSIMIRRIHEHIEKRTHCRSQIYGCRFLFYSTVSFATDTMQAHIDTDQSDSLKKIQS